MRRIGGSVPCVILVTICVLSAPLASANVIMGNLPAVNSEFNGQFGPEAGDRKHAISFTMPAGDPVPLGTVRLDLGCIVCPTVTNITVRGDNAGEPDPTIQVTLAGPAINGTGILEFAPNTPFHLQPGTTYWIVVDGEPRGLWRANSAGNYPTSDIGAVFGAQLEYSLGAWAPTTTNPDFVFNFEVTTEIFTDGFESGDTTAWSTSTIPQLAYESSFETNDPAFEDVSGVGVFSNTPPPGTTARTGTRVITNSTITTSYTGRAIQSVDCIELLNDTDPLVATIHGEASTVNGGNEISGRIKMLWFTDSGCTTPHATTDTAGTGITMPEGGYVAIEFNELPPIGATHFIIRFEVRDNNGGFNTQDDWAADDLTVDQ
jgi:hypothetical protein